MPSVSSIYIKFRSSSSRVLHLFCFNSVSVAQFVDGERTHNADLADSSFDSLNLSLGEGDDAKYFHNGSSLQQEYFSQQSGYPTCGGEVLMSGFPASHTPPVHDCVFDPEVAMLSVNNVKNQFMDDNQFLE